MDRTSSREPTVTTSPALRSGAPRGTVTRGCLIGAPLLLFVGALLLPATDADPVTYLAGLARSPARGELSTVFSLAGLVVLIAAITSTVFAGSGGVGAGRGCGLTRTGGAVTVGSAVGLAALVGTNLYDIRLAQLPDRGEAVELYRAVQGLPATVAIQLAGAAGLGIGLLLLLTGARRAGLVPVWVPLAVPASFVLLNVSASPLVSALGWLPLLAALGRLAVAGPTRGRRPADGDPA